MGWLVGWLGGIWIGIWGGGWNGVWGIVTCVVVGLCIWWGWGGCGNVIIGCVCIWEVNWFWCSYLVFSLYGCCGIVGGCWDDGNGGGGGVIGGVGVEEGIIDWEGWRLWVVVIWVRICDSFFC